MALRQASAHMVGLEAKVRSASTHAPANILYSGIWVRKLKFMTVSYIAK